MVRGYCAADCASGILKQNSNRFMSTRIESEAGSVNFKIRDMHGRAIFDKDLRTQVSVET
jgi:hypothetical protein